MSTEHIEITQSSKTNFLYSFSLLPKDKYEAINTVYAFCRQTDDIVDNEMDSTELKFRKIREWKNEFEKALKGTSSYALLNQVTKIIRNFNIPVEPFFELIKGMEADLQVSRYKDFNTLYQYCFRAAATVGLMCIEIFGYKTQSAKEYAVNLGIALQLTNILRDVKFDALNGRIYLPEEDMKKFGYTEDDLMNFRYNESFVELMKYECKRARDYFEKANNAFAKEDRKQLFPARIMQKIYFNILQKIEKMNYNVFSKKAKVSKLKKLYYTFGVFVKYKLAY
ncbi:MAG TPA: squalene/phytoene synthase family protein [Ignavibacteria bacterium]|nr:squalene/phytoene synthase family protein [Ignavibacteria bacterium]HRF67101.1 squalene/phytoene synthase family protein [Ignavibacteria bacterium]HRJ05157.1 squalene/phytoene synthase family protein [Ignavibacteria bacterium]